MLTFIYIVHTYTVYMYKTFSVTLLLLWRWDRALVATIWQDQPTQASLTACAGLSEASGCKCHIVVFGARTHTRTHTLMLYGHKKERRKKTPASAKNSASSTAAWQNVTPPPQNHTMKCRNTVVAISTINSSAEIQQIDDEIKKTCIKCE